MLMPCLSQASSALEKDGSIKLWVDEVGMKASAVASASFTRAKAHSCIELHIPVQKRNPKP